MIKNFARLCVALLVLLMVTTGCALPASPETAAPAAVDSPPVVVETVPATAVETATALPQPTSTEAATSTAQPTEHIPLLVETPERDVVAVESQETEEATVDVATGPTDEQQWVLDGLPSLGLAPELRNDLWLNSEPLRLADLRGKVVLLDMWTFG